MIISQTQAAVAAVVIVFVVVFVVVVVVVVVLRYTVCSFPVLRFKFLLPMGVNKV